MHSLYLFSYSNSNHTATHVLVVVDPDLIPEETELCRIADEIKDIWKEVGIKLGLEERKLTKIAINNPGRDVMAAKDMLLTWNCINKKVSRRMLYQAIKWCRTNKGMYH